MPPGLSWWQTSEPRAGSRLNSQVQYHTSMWQASVTLRCCETIPSSRILPTARHQAMDRQPRLQDKWWRCEPRLAKASPEEMLSALPTSTMFQTAAI